MKRYIVASESNNSILFDAIITVDIEIPVISVESSTSVNFPGVKQFLSDVVNILEDEYKFYVIADSYNDPSVFTKGHISNRIDSNSIYIDTYYDLSNSRNALDNVGATNVQIPEGKIECFIHLRFSDHILNDAGDTEHLDYLTKNAKKYTKDHPVDFVYKEESFEVAESDLYRHYNDALDDLKDQLNARILYWVNKANKKLKEG